LLIFDWQRREPWWETVYICVNLGYQCLMWHMQWFTFIVSYFVILDLNPT
jgi:hypothetical protein